jgi:hypothetical protein
MRNAVGVTAIGILLAGCLAHEKAATGETTGSQGRTPAAVSWLLEDCGTNHMGCYTVSEHATSGACRTALRDTPAPSGRVRGCRPRG